MARIAAESETNRTEVQRAEDRLEQQRITFDALFSLINKLGTTFDVSKIVRLFLMTVMGQLRVTRVTLYLVVPERRCLEPYHWLGVAGADSLPPLEVGSNAARWFADAAGPVRLDELSTALGDAAGVDEEMMRRFIERGFSHGIALADQGTLLGVLMYSGAVTGETFSDFDNELLSVLTRVASITIRNAFLYQDAVESKLELERFSEVKREFISHTSHELRTPLTVLQSALGSIEPDAVADGMVVGMARDAVARLQTRVEYLLSLNDIELSVTDLALSQCEISELVQEALHEIIPELEEKQVHVAVDDRAINRKVMVDAARVKIALRSILENAISFVGRRGNIDVVTRVSECRPSTEEGIEIGDWRARPPDVFDARAIGGASSDGERAQPRPAGNVQDLHRSPYVVISIRDDGIGIPSEEIGTLALPFTMASNSTNRNVKGLGIGLSVAQKIVAGHGGKIFCKSELGQGAQFSIWLPLNA